MTQDAGMKMAEALAGIGGAPGRPGRAYVIGVPDDVMSMTARAAVLLASADCILTDGPVDDPLFRMAGDVPVMQRRVGDPVKPGKGVVVRVVRGSRSTTWPAWSTNWPDSTAPASTSRSNRCRPVRGCRRS
jgi:siroheme synthase